MSNNRRSTRLKSSIPSSKLFSNAAPSSVYFVAKSSSVSHETVRLIPPGSELPGLSPTELGLLRKKQSRLALTASSTLHSLPDGLEHRNALEASLILAQYEAGTAICVDPAGWVLTCSHCFGDTEEEWRANKCKWLLFYDGLAVQVECRAWDPKRDLALLKIIIIEASISKDGNIPNFRFVPLSSHAPVCKDPIICIGQPGLDDLESTSNRPTKYNLVEVSEGTFCGMVPGADPHDNSEIGSLKHDAWTYWGHSGAPLLCKGDGTLLGIHSSWDDQTAMRHGVPLVAIRTFLENKLPAAFDSSSSTSSIPLELYPSKDKTTAKFLNKKNIPTASTKNLKRKNPLANSSKASPQSSIIVIDDED